MSLLVLFGLSLAFGILLHKLIAGLLTPSLLAALGSSVVFHAIGFLLEGRLDSMVMISLITTSMVAFLIALGIGVIMRRAGTKPGGDSRKDHR